MVSSSSWRLMVVKMCGNGGEGCGSGCESWGSSSESYGGGSGGHSE